MAGGSQHASGQQARIRGRRAIVTVAWGACTHPGNRRELNEDALCAEPPIFAVADGMGGHQSGEVAAALAAGALGSLASPQAVDPNLLRRSIIETNRLIYARSGGGERAMGTTVSGIAISQSARPEVAVFNVGDSRTYRWEGGQLDQVTVDHSHVQELVDAGEITSEEALTHPERNIVTRALGVDPEVEADISLYPAVSGQRWIVCSDGLSGELSSEILGDLAATGSPQDAADAFIATTLAGPARDNISVVVVDIVGVELIEDLDRTDPRRGRDATEPNHRLPRPSAAGGTAPDLIDAVPFASAPVDVPALPSAPAGGLIDEVPAGAGSVEP